MRRILQKIPAPLLWLAPLSWCALVFWASSQPPPPGPEIEIPHLDKVIHIIIYAVMAFLWWIALTANLPKKSTRQLALIAFLLSVAYGISDEYHQSKVDTRTADPMDVVADAIGAASIFFVSRKMEGGRPLPPQSSS